MYIKPTKEAQGSIFDVHEDADLVLLYPANEDVPCPWDADITVQSGTVRIVGGLGAGGHGGNRCVCECTVDNFTTYYKLEVPDDNDDLLNALASAGWERV